jgi:hypothetical protein
VEEIDMAATELDRLAECLRRPPRSLQAFRHLTADQLVDLREAVDAACARQHASLDRALSDAAPGPLRGLVLRLLRGRAR